MGWLLTIQVLPRVLCIPVGDIAAGDVPTLAARARIVARVPATDLTAGIVSLSSGDVPHPSVGAEVRSVAELTAAVPQAQVDSYLAAQAEAGQQTRLTSTQDAVAALPAVERDMLRQRLGWSPGPRPS